jgi:hypothetical protein
LFSAVFVSTEYSLPPSALSVQNRATPFRYT